jgi:hypothetical protein
MRRHHSGHGDAAKKKRGLSLLLAASDMEQAAAAAEAAEALAAKIENIPLIRALHTAVAVCYWRPFTSGSLVIKLGPSEVPPGDLGLHDELKRARDKFYAHTDAASERHALSLAPESYMEEWWEPLEDSLPAIVKLCREQAERFRAEAARLDPPGSSS